jgi:cellulose synthase/poly-beta-1,6-N-acetylglucosamine synthase-like glycosyltransferase
MGNSNKGLVKLATVISRQEISSADRNIIDNLSPTISVVIPVYNEEENISELYRRVKEVLDTLEGECELVLVDDGSKDDSFALMCSISASDPRVKVVKLRRNYGQTAALSAGFDQAQGEVIVTLDADLQKDYSSLWRVSPLYSRSRHLCRRADCRARGKSPTPETGKI